MANASKKHGMGAGLVQGHQTTGEADPNALDEDDLAGEMASHNRLHGHDPDRVRNERHSLPGSQDTRNQPDAVVERLESEAQEAVDREADPA